MSRTALVAVPETGRDVRSRDHTLTFPEEHRTKIYSANPLERVNGEIKRRTDVVGIFGSGPHVTPPL